MLTKQKVHIHVTILVNLRSHCSAVLTQCTSHILFGLHSKLSLVGPHTTHQIINGESGFICSQRHIFILKLKEKVQSFNLDMSICTCFSMNDISSVSIVLYMYA